MMINDPEMKQCPICHQDWGAHAKNCKYYSRPQVMLRNECDPIWLLVPMENETGLTRKGNAMYWYAVFSLDGRETGIRAFAYNGRDEAIAVARGWLSESWAAATLVSCEPDPLTRMATVDRKGRVVDL